ADLGADRHGSGALVTRAFGVGRALVGSGGVALAPRAAGLRDRTGSELARGDLQRHVARSRRRAAPVDTGHDDGRRSRTNDRADRAAAPSQVRAAGIDAAGRTVAE